MPFFRKPQEKKGSAVSAGAHSGKQALAKEKRGFRMPFFGGKKEEPTQEKQERKEEQKTSEKEAGDSIQAPARERFGSASEVIFRPRVTEKATDMSSSSNAYVFDVHPSATKNQIAEGIKELYGVTPVKVHVVNRARKHVRGRRGEHGLKGGGRKAYVYLKKGDTIEFV